MNGFIIGTGRCGSTMLASILNSHTQVCVPPETQLLFQYGGNGNGLFELFEAGVNFGVTAEQLIAFVEKRCPHNLIDFFDYPTYFNSQTYPATRLEDLMGGFYSAIADARFKTICIEQTPWYGQRIDVLDFLYPASKYIHMVRDGRDVAISFSRTPWWHSSVEHNMIRWAAEVNRIQALSSRILAPEQVMMVRYEDFVEQPEDKLKEICEFLGIDYQESMLDAQNNIDYGAFDKSSLSHISSSALSQWQSKKSSSVFKDSVQAWKKFQDYDFSSTPEHVKQCLDRLGYPT